MKVSPVEIQNQSFKTAFRGYDRESVDAYLELIAAQMEDLLRENSFVKEELEKANTEVKRLREMEQMLKDTVIAAQKMAEGYRENAKKEAELIVANARANAEKIVYAAERRLSEVNGHIARITARITEIKEVVRGILGGFIEHIDLAIFNSDAKNGNG